MAELREFEGNQLYLFTSLTAGSSHIVTATSRIETILKNARIPFTYIDTATNENAKKLFQRRARGKRLPFLVKDGFPIADLDEVEEWNEFDELEDNIGEVSTHETSHIVTTPAKMEQVYPSPGPIMVPTAITGATPRPAASAATTPSKPEPKKENTAPQQGSTMASLAQEAAAKAKQIAKKVPTPILPKAEKKEEQKEDGAGGVRAEKVQEKERDSPLSPSGVPLPMSPAVKSPTSTSGVKSPTSHHRHSSTGSVHSFIPEKSEPEVKEHRGSEISAASEEEIKHIEAACSIAEVDEDALEEEEEDAKDAPTIAASAESKKHRGSEISAASTEEIKRIESETRIEEEEEDEEEEGSGDSDDEPSASAPSTATAPTATKKSPEPSISKPALTPVEEDKPLPPSNPTPASPKAVLNDDELDDALFGDDDEDDVEEVDLSNTKTATPDIAKKPAQQPQPAETSPSTTSPTAAPKGGTEKIEAVLKSASASASATNDEAKAEGKTTSDTAMKPAADPQTPVPDLKTQAQKAADPKQASASVED